MESRRSDICYIDIHRGSYAKHWRSKQLLENTRPRELFIPEWLFKEEQTPFKKKIKKVYNPKTLRQIASDKIKFVDTELEKYIAKNMIIP